MLVITIYILSNIQNLLEIVIYPNPNQGVFNLIVPKESSGNYKIYNLLDHLGKKDVFFDHIGLINNRMKFIFWININEEKTKKFKKLKVKKYSTKLFNSFLIPINKINHFPKYRSLNFSMGDTDTFIKKI